MSEQKKCPSCGRRLQLRQDGCWPRHTPLGSPRRSAPCPTSGLSYSATNALAKVGTSVRRYHDLIAENQRALGCALVRMDPNCYRSQAEYEEAATLVVKLRENGFNVTMVQSQYPGIADPDTWGILVNGQTYVVHGANLVSLDELNKRAGGSSAQAALAKADKDGTLPTFLTNPPPQFAAP